MEGTQELICSYFDEKKIAYTNSCYSCFCYHAQFSATAQLQDCKVEIIPISNLIQISVTLPIRVKRTEASDVNQEIALINEALPEYAGYILNPLNGSIQLVIHTDKPTDAEQMDKKLSVAIKAAEEDIDSIIETLTIAKAENKRKETESKDGASDEDSESETKTVSLASKFLSFIGLVNNEDQTDDDFDD